MFESCLSEDDRRMDAVFADARVILPEDVPVCYAAGEARRRKPRPAAAGASGRRRWMQVW